MSGFEMSEDTARDYIGKRVSLIGVPSMQGTVRAVYKILSSGRYEASVDFDGVSEPIRYGVDKLNLNPGFRWDNAIIPNADAPSASGGAKKKSKKGSKKGSKKMDGGKKGPKKGSKKGSKKNKK